MNKLRQLDLNLLLTLHVLLREKHISKTAEMLHKSQPAISHALDKLRTFFNDPLLMRAGNNMALTATAQNLQTPLAAVLDELNCLLGGSEFNPQTYEHTFRLAMSDYASSVILPMITAKLRQIAPRVRLIISQPPSRESLLEKLANSEIDLAFGVFSHLPEGISVSHLFDEQFVCVSDKKNGYEQVDLATWAALPHIALSLRPQANEEMEKALFSQGFSLNKTVTMPHWNASLDMLTGTDLMLTISARLADKLPHYPDLVQFAPPLALPQIEYLMLWQEHKTRDSGILWLRELIMAFFNES
ncbi:LysR family transcriptional regulator [Cricetibacter osteomyelitidis]|uniref:LysR family transcriptional regulator n=1 Tax=Cricetibacter osteomyelitidis TaxID=1521931 RepID=A0A4R2SVS6_9PAST|nr:LysR family transcriptional regulator [Cricetibacter osteomyelitidis]TCP93405.1 LysR family transcriptional regulator [Cricetibacter osteomyelitidis]